MFAFAGFSDAQMKAVGNKRSKLKLDKLDKIITPGLRFSRSFFD